MKKAIHPNDSEPRATLCQNSFNQDNVNKIGGMCFKLITNTKDVRGMIHFCNPGMVSKITQNKYSIYNVLLDDSIYNIPLDDWIIEWMWSQGLPEVWTDSVEFWVFQIYFLSVSTSACLRVSGVLTLGYILTGSTPDSL